MGRVIIRRGVRPVIKPVEWKHAWVVLEVKVALPEISTTLDMQGEEHHRIIRRVSGIAVCEKCDKTYYYDRGIEGGVSSPSRLILDAAAAVTYDCKFP